MGIPRYLAEQQEKVLKEHGYSLDGENIIKGNDPSKVDEKTVSSLEPGIKEKEVVEPIAFPDDVQIKKEEKTGLPEEKKEEKKQDTVDSVDFKSELEELKNKISKSEQQNKELNGMLKRFGNDNSKLQKKIKAIEDEKERLLLEKTKASVAARTQELADNFGSNGEEVINGIRDITKSDILSEVDIHIKPLRDKILELESTKRERDEKDFYGEINKIPYLAEIDNFPDFKRHILTETDYFGNTLDSLIKMAEENLDPMPIRRIVADFEKKHGKPSTPEQKREKLDDMVTPPRGSGPNETIQQQPKLTQKQVIAFYRDYDNRLRSGLMSSEEKKQYAKKAEWIDHVRASGGMT